MPRSKRKLWKTQKKSPDRPTQLRKISYVGHKKSKPIPSQKESQLDVILKRLPFSENTLAAAVLDQAPLFRDMSKYRVACLRKRNRAELDLKAKNAEVYLQLRDRPRSEKKKLTETELKHQIELHPEIKAARLLLAQYEELDELAQHMQEAVRMRRDSLKIYALLIPGSNDMTVQEKRKWAMQ